MGEGAMQHWVSRVKVTVYSQVFTADLLFMYSEQNWVVYAVCVSLINDKAHCHSCKMTFGMMWTGTALMF